MKKKLLLLVSMCMFAIGCLCMDAFANDTMTWSDPQDYIVGESIQPIFSIKADDAYTASVIAIFKNSSGNTVKRFTNQIPGATSETTMNMSFSLGTSLAAGTYSYQITIQGNDPDNSYSNTITGYFMVVEVLDSATVDYLTLRPDMSVGVSLLFTMSSAYECTAQFEYQNNSTELEKSDLDTYTYNSKEYSMYTVDCLAKEMSDTITFTVRDQYGNKFPIIKNGTKVDGYKYTYSANTYVDYVAENESSLDSKLVNLVYAMSDYGSMAQEYFNYNTSAREAIKNSASIAAVTASTLSSYAKKVDDTSAPEGVGYKYISLFGYNNVTPRLYVTLPTGKTLKDYTVSTGTIGTYNQYGTVTLDAFGITQLGTSKTVTISSGSQKLSVTFSPYSYIYSVLSSSTATDTLKDTMRALYLYSQAAKAYSA